MFEFDIIMQELKITMEYELTLFKKVSPVTLDDETALYYLYTALQMVERYVNNNNIDVKKMYRNQVVQTAIWLVSVAQQSKATTENGGIQSLSANGRSVSWFGLGDFSNLELPSHIKAQLPHYVRCF